jgi:hypothetical protein
MIESMRAKSCAPRFERLPKEVLRVMTAPRNALSAALLVGYSYRIWWINSDLPFERKLYLVPDGFNTGEVPLRGDTTVPRPSQAPIGVRWPPLSHSQAVPIDSGGSGHASRS